MKKKSRHTYTLEQEQFIIENHQGMSNPQLTEIFNKRFNTELTVQQIRMKRYNLGIKNYSVLADREYALYKGDNLLAMGTLSDIANERGISPHTVYFYGSKAYRQRTSEENGLRLIRLDA